VVLEVTRPEIDTQPICSLEWDIERKTLRQFRVWSGEFTARFSENPLIVASHSKMAAMVLKLPGRLQRLPAGGVLEGIPNGAPDNVVRTVTENCRTLKFESSGFEES